MSRGAFRRGFAKLTPCAALTLLVAVTPVLSANAAAANADRPFVMTVPAAHDTAVGWIPWAVEVTAPGGLSPWGAFEGNAVVARVEEDSPEWDCSTMGNGWCGASVDPPVDTTVIVRCKGDGFLYEGTTESAPWAEGCDLVAWSLPR